MRGHDLAELDSGGASAEQVHEEDTVLAYVGQLRALTSPYEEAYSGDGGGTTGWGAGWDKNSDGNVQVFASAVAVSKDQCKNGGWKNLVRANGTPFKNQGDAIQYVNTGK